MKEAAPRQALQQQRLSRSRGGPRGRRRLLNDEGGVEDEDASCREGTSRRRAFSQLSEASSSAVSESEALRPSQWRGKEDPLPLFISERTCFLCFLPEPLTLWDLVLQNRRTKRSETQGNNRASSKNTSPTPREVGFQRRSFVGFACRQERRVPRLAGAGAERFRWLRVLQEGSSGRGTSIQQQDTTDDPISLLFEGPDKATNNAASTGESPATARNGGQEGAEADFLSLFDAPGGDVVGSWNLRSPSLRFSAGCAREARRGFLV